MLSWLPDELLCRVLEILLYDHQGKHPPLEACLVCRRFYRCFKPLAYKRVLLTGGRSLLLFTENIRASLAFRAAVHVPASATMTGYSFDPLLVQEFVYRDTSVSIPIERLMIILWNCRSLESISLHFCWESIVSELNMATLDFSLSETLPTLRTLKLFLRVEVRALDSLSLHHPFWSHVTHLQINSFRQPQRLPYLLLRRLTHISFHVPWTPFSTARDTMEWLNLHLRSLPQSTQVVAFVFYFIERSSRPPLFPLAVLDQIMALTHPAIVIGFFHKVSGFTEEERRYFGTLIFDSAIDNTEETCRVLAPPNPWQVGTWANVDRMISARHQTPTEPNF